MPDDDYPFENFDDVDYLNPGSPSQNEAGGLNDDAEMSNTDDKAEDKDKKSQESDTEMKEELPKDFATFDKEGGVAEEAKEGQKQTEETDYDDMPPLEWIYGEEPPAKWAK